MFRIKVSVVSFVRYLIELQNKYKWHLKFLIIGNERKIEEKTLERVNEMLSANVSIRFRKTSDFVSLLDIKVFI